MARKLQLELPRASIEPELPAPPQALKPEQLRPISLLPADASVPGVPINDAADELAASIDGRINERINILLNEFMTGQQTSPETWLNTFGRRRLYEAVKHFEDRLLVSTAR
jgi:hypothetical protein